MSRIKAGIGAVADALFTYASKMTAARADAESNRIRIVIEVTGGVVLLRQEERAAP